MVEKRKKVKLAAVIFIITVFLTACEIDMKEPTMPTISQEEEKLNSLW